MKKNKNASLRGTKQSPNFASQLNGNFLMGVHQNILAL